MTTDEQLVNDFYTAFQNKDYKFMQQCYADKATFYDPVFSNLNANEVRGMWEILIQRGKDLQLEFSNIRTEGKMIKANWVATYTFSKTKRKVVNNVEGIFVVTDGKIISHNDNFNFHQWAKQALGGTGLLLGWTSFLQNKVSKQALNSLQNFMNK